MLIWDFKYNAILVPIRYCIKYSVGLKLVFLKLTVMTPVPLYEHATNIAARGAHCLTLDLFSQPCLDHTQVPDEGRYLLKASEVLLLAPSTHQMPFIGCTGCHLSFLMLVDWRQKKATFGHSSSAVLCFSRVKPNTDLFTVPGFRNWPDSSLCFQDKTQHFVDI